jgi:OmpA-OmpF porin, OOP family
MKTKAVVAALGIAAATLALPAAAQMSMSSGYIGGSLGQSNFKADCGGIDCDKKDTSFRIFGGYQFTPNIAAELGYTDLGKLKVDLGPFGSGDVSATAWDLSGVFTWPIANQFGVFGRIGFARVEAKPGGVLGGDSETKTGLTWGLGGSYDFNRNLGLRLEFQRFRADAGGGDTADIDNLSLGVVWRFQ